MSNITNNSKFLHRYTNTNDIDNDIIRQGWNIQSRVKSSSQSILERDTNINKPPPVYVDRQLSIPRKFDDLMKNYKTKSIDNNKTVNSKSIYYNNDTLNYNNLNNADINTRNIELKKFDEINKLAREIDGYKKEIVNYKQKMNLIRDKDLELHKANMSVEKYKRIYARVPELEKELTNAKKKIIDMDLKITTHKNSDMELIAVKNRLNTLAGFSCEMPSP